MKHFKYLFCITITNSNYSSAQQ